MGRSTNNVEHKSEPRPEGSGFASAPGLPLENVVALTAASNRSLPVAARIFLLLFLACLMAFPAPAAAAGLDAEKALLAQGKYKEALAQLEKVWAKAPDNPEALAALLEAKLQTGDYRGAFEQGEEFLKRPASPGVTSGVAEWTAEAACRIGEYERAADLLEKVSTTLSTPRADWLRGVLADRKGDIEAARAAMERVAGLLTQRARLASGDRALVAYALAELGRFKEANQVYQEAVKSDPKNASLRADWGSLMARTHNPADAEQLYGEALHINSNHTGAMVGMAELAAGRWEARAAEWLQRAFQVNPNLAEAHLLVTRTALEQDDFKTAEEHLDQVLKVNPRLLEAWSLRGVSDYLQEFNRGNNGTVEQGWIPRILKENPRYGKVFADLGDFIALKRQIPAAVEFYRRALAADPSLDEVRADLGVNLFRLGQEEEARSVLEEAYRRDPYNVSTVNTLRLMDSFSHFDTFETPHFSVKLQKKESQVLRPYVADLLEKTMENLAARYGYTPRQKTTFEMYPDHEDFAVRTLGLPGLGALGATFGTVVAMDSPSARPLGTFHWGSTLWHEATHIISLGMTSGRVPRWFTEGLSVYEETQARPGWGDPMEPQTVQALQANKLLPLENLNAAFIHPQSPGQVPFAYFQAGMICQYIVEKYGFPKILAMLHSYGQGRSDSDAIKEALGTTIAEFDSDFLKYAKEHTFGFAEALDMEWASPARKVEELREEAQKHPRNFFARLHLAAALQKESHLEEAEAHAQAAKELFPLFVGSGNPYGILADIYEAMDQKEKAVAELELWREKMGRNPETFKKLARLLKDTGRTREAIRTLEEALYISMFDIDIHDRLGEWYLESANPGAAVREYQVVLALAPADLAGAHYHLAKAYRVLSDNRNARLEVLAALEIAPGFRPAQKLLLELSDK